MLRILICGDAQGGKSTLLGMLLSGAGSVGENPDSVAGVAWRRFRTQRRELVLADAPGRPEYTGNTAAAAARSDLALIVVDAQRGIAQQTRRHAAIAHLMSVGRLVVVVNKMDLAGWKEPAFIAIRDEFMDFATRLGAGASAFVPVCAALGDNVVSRGRNMAWYAGPTLLDLLETIETRAPVNDAIPAADAVETDRLQANLVWAGSEPLLPGRRYELRTGSAAVPATVNRLIHRLNPATLANEPTTHLEKNEIGRCEMLTERPVVCSPAPGTAQFALLDRLSGATLAVGVVTAQESRRLFWERGSVDKAVRAGAKGQRPRVLWFTGLSGAGKSTLANAVEEALVREGLHTYLVDGDNVRHGLSKDLGFGAEDRIENTRRVGELAKLMADAGLIVLVSLISPFRAERRMVRELLEPGEFVEVHVSTPLAVCEARDRKGLYRMARAGTLKEFTGISSPYEPPEAAEVVTDTSTEPLESCVRRIVDLVRAR